MKRLFWIVPSVLVLSWSVQAKTIDRILAQVNDDIITMSDLNREMTPVRHELESKYTGEELEKETKEAEKAILDDLIRQKLLLQKANELGFGANVDVQVSAALQRIMKENGIPDQETLERALVEQGLTLLNYREQLKKRIITQSLVQEFVGSRITLLTQEIEKYYRDHLDDFSTPEEVGLSEILIPSTGDQADAQARARDIEERLKKGESFATLASQYSKGPTANKGGNIGTYLVAKLNPDVAKAIAGVKEGDVTPVQPIKDGYVIYRVDSRKPVTVRPLEAVREEIKGRIWEQKFNPEYERFVSQLREDAYVQLYTENK